MNRKLSDSDSSDNSHPSDFPLTDHYIDCAGIERVIEIDAHVVPTGWLLVAREVGREPHGYEFKALSGISPYHALGDLRAKIRRNLAVKYLSGEGGDLTLSHDVMRGRIAYDAETGSHGILVDGRFLSTEQLERILAGYEGWEFELSIHD